MGCGIAYSEEDIGTTDIGEQVNYPFEIVIPVNNKFAHT
jgi:hypothetical protein